MATVEARNALEWVFIPAEKANTMEKRKQQLARARQRYEAKTLRENHHADKNKPKNRERPFIAWDGEGPQDAGYALFGNSEGYEICNPFLSTLDCLSLILETGKAHPYAIHIAYGFNYDASMILKDLPWRCLNALKHYGVTIWNGLEIEHIPNKWFRVRGQGVNVQIFDICNFWATGYVQALLAMGIGTDNEITHLTNEKNRRGDFMYSEIEDIKAYWRLELRLMPRLAEKLRSAFLDAGYDLRSWHGPGALANMAMKRHGVYEAMAETPVDVRIAARYAFAGGRFEMFRGGYIQQRVYNADINSAYPHYARELPDLTKGTWRRGRDYEAAKFAVYRIRYGHHPRRGDALRADPLFRRMQDGTVSWPHETEGWYWAPEAELVANDPDATFIESWVFDEDNSASKPFAWLDEYYRRRQYLKRNGNVLELTFKLIINSVYGRLAQRTGYDRKHRKAPRSHQLEWAGYITSACRAAIHKEAIALGDKLISIDTDGIYSLAPFGNLYIGTDLGQWEVNEYEEGIFWQSGIYTLKRDGEWLKGKSRGIRKGSYAPADLIQAIETNNPLTLTRKSFTGYGLALNGQRDKLNTWTNEPYEVIFGGQGKRYHNIPQWCAKGKCGNDGVHSFIPVPRNRIPGDNVDSRAHYLPWLGNDPLAETTKRLVSDYAAYDASDLEAEDGWVDDYVP